MKLHRDGDRLLQLLIFNEEYLVGACHQRASITSLPFVHTARRSYRLNDPVRPPDCGNAAGSPAAMPREAVRTLSFRGRRSRNKVSVGEPAEGSLPVFPTHTPVAPFYSDSGSQGPDAAGSAAEFGWPPHHALRVLHCMPLLCAFLANAPPIDIHTTPADGYLGSRNDEERSEMRYVVRIAEFSESSNL